MLSAFYVGHLSAGQLTGRLAAAGERSQPSPGIEADASVFAYRDGQRMDGARASSGAGRLWRRWLIALVASRAPQP